MTMDKKDIAALETHLRQWKDIAERIRTQMSPALNVQGAIQKSLKPILEAREALQKTLEPILAQQESWRQQMASIRIPRFYILDISHFAKQAADFQRTIQESISPIFEQLQKSFHDLPPRTQEALLLLGEHGWYMDSKMPFSALWDLKEALSEGKVQDAEDALSEYFESRLQEIEETITQRFPHREHLIKAAFNAHRRQDYDLSIPVFLAQTDGICKEVAGQYLFMKQNKKPRTAIYVEQLASDAFTAALLSPLAAALPIGTSEDQRPEGFSALNRHMVMHGESLDYGTKINSLKAISLVNYVADVLAPKKESSDQASD